MTMLRYTGLGMVLVALAAVGVLTGSSMSITRNVHATPSGGDVAGDPIPDVSPADAALSKEEIVSEVAALAPELLARYIRVDTTNPPGNELEGVKFLSSVLESEGIQTKIFEPAPGRGNLYARLKGSGEKSPIILLSHVDVVPANPDLWDQAPLAGAIAGGAVYGRGALDAKGIGIVQLLSVIALKRAQIELARDVILLATADEEAGGALGVGWMMREQHSLFSDAEFVLNEGGFIRAGDGQPLIYNVNAAEKGPCWFRVVASGEPGHASRPPAETSVTRLVAALEKLATWKRPYEVGPVVAGYYAAYAMLDEKHARQLRQLERSLEDAEFYAWFTTDPAAAALIYDTLTPTVLRASTKTNVIPAEAVAEVDSRLLPGHECEDFLAEARKQVASEHVRIEAMEVAFPSTQSPLANDLTSAVEQLATEERTPSIVLPGLQAGFTDSHYFRAKGVAAYGFTPIVVTAAQRNAVENVGSDELRAGVRRMTRLLELVSQ